MLAVRSQLVSSPRRCCGARRGTSAVGRVEVFPKDHKLDGSPTAGRRELTVVEQAALRSCIHELLERVSGPAAGVKGMKVLRTRQPAIQTFSLPILMTFS